MSIFYSATSNAFYDSGINRLPSDAIEITQELHVNLLQKQSEGYTIKPNKSGNPIAVKSDKNIDSL